MSSLAVIIDRQNYYRLLGPIVEAALREGRDVECWLDQNPPSKPWEFPSAERAPRFKFGTPTFRGYQGGELQDWLRKRRVDNVISVNTPAHYMDDPSDTRPRWAAVQENLDYFTINGPDGVLSTDVSAMLTPWWVDWGAEYFRVRGVVTDTEAYAAQLRQRAVAVGFPEIDQATDLDPARVRERWGIPANQPVVLLVPFSGAANGGFWSTRIHLEPSRARRLAWVLGRRRFEYLPHALRRVGDTELVAAVRSFCDRNGAFLLVKSRPKTPIPPYLARVADHCVYDESVYPATILEALSVASVCISLYSTVVFEAAVLRVPHVCVTFSMRDYLDGQAERIRRSEFAFHTEEGGFFNTRGVSEAMSVAEAIATLPARRLEEFTVDEAAVRRYVAKYLGPEDRRSSGRVLAALDAVERQ